MRKIVSVQALSPRIPEMRRSVFESAIAGTDFTDWKTLVFLYPQVYSAVRIAPVGGNLRGVLGAILLLGVGGATVGMLFNIGASCIVT